MPNLRNPMLNMVVLQGRVGRDPELKFISSGRAVCSFSVCNTEFYYDDQKTRHERNMWIDVTCWGDLAERIAEKLHKGSDVQIVGKLEQQEWQEKGTGQKRSKHVLVAREVRAMAWPDGDAAQQPQQAQRPQRDNDEEVPF